MVKQVTLANTLVTAHNCDLSPLLRVRTLTVFMEKKILGETNLVSVIFPPRKKFVKFVSEGEYPCVNKLSLDYRVLI